MLGTGLTFVAPTRSNYNFEGWYKESGFINPITAILPADSGDKTIYAKWTPKDYEITYSNLLGGTNDADNLAAYTYGVGLTLKDPVRPGYSFGGWYTEIEFVNEITAFTADDSGDKEIFAKWNPKPYTVNLNYGSGIKNVTDTTNGSIEASYGEEMTTFPANPSKISYVFTGWWTEPNGGGTKFINGTVWTIDEDDITLYAHYAPVNIITGLEYGNGTQDPGTFTTTYGTAVSGLPAGIVKPNYTFGGWWTDIDGGGREYTDGDVWLEIAAIPILYAYWIPDTYVITYHLNNGVNAPENTTTYAYGTGLMLQPPTRDGCTFGGWYTDADFNNIITHISGTDIGEKTLYAKWTGESYAIIYELNEGTNHNENPLNYVYGVGCGLNAPTRTGYVFCGWFTDAEFTAGNQISVISTTDTGVKSLYAKWAIREYIVELIYQGGTPHADDIGFIFTAYNQTVEGLLTPLKAGFAFGGWWTEAGGNGAEYANGTVWTFDGETPQLFAHWFVKKFTVNFNSNGGSQIAAINNIESGALITMPAPPTRAGYEFTGWYADEGLTAKWDFSVSTVSIDRTLYAGWKEAAPGDADDTTACGSVTAGGGGGILTAGFAACLGFFAIHYYRKKQTAKSVP